MRYNIIGAGKLGANIALALSQNTEFTLQAVCNRTLSSAKLSCQTLGFGEALASLEDLPPVDLTWITCSDDSISSVVAALAEKALLRPGSWVVHCSGVLSSSILQPLSAFGCQIASIHPLKAFRKDYLDAQAFSGVYCALEGDTLLCAELTKLFTGVGAEVQRIQPQAKVAYHAAASMASNYLVTLMASSEKLLVQAGFSAVRAKLVLADYMQMTLDSIRGVQETRQALTGPLQRGDSHTLFMHLQAIEDPLVKRLYQAAAEATLELTDLDWAKQLEIKKVLQ